MILGKSIIGAQSIADLASKLKTPRRIVLLVKAGPAVDSFIDQLLPHLEKVCLAHSFLIKLNLSCNHIQGDIIIDGGNSEYQDSERRSKALQEKGIRFVGSGVSGLCISINLYCTKK